MAQYQLGAQSSNRKTFFGFHLHLSERSCKNLQSAMDPARYKSGPAIIWFIGVTIHCTIFQQLFSNSLQLPSFYAQNTLKKLAMKNAD